VTVGSVKAIIEMPAGGNATVQVRLTNASNQIVLGTAETLTPADDRQHTATFNPAVTGIKEVAVLFTGLSGQPALRTVKVYANPASAASAQSSMLARMLSPLRVLRDALEPSSALAAPAHQPFPPVQAKPTPIIIGAPQIPNATLPPGPGVPIAPPQQAPTGRVAFTIVGQVRPGGR
jgi:hypothetical protein